MKPVYIVLIFLSALFGVRCGQKGCRDPRATDYCAECKRADASCQYQGKLILWYKADVRDSLIAHNNLRLYLYINDNLMGQYNSIPSGYDLSAPGAGSGPDCSYVNGLFNDIRNLGNSPQKSFSYKVTNQYENVLWSGEVQYDAGTPCTLLQLVWKP